MRAAQSLERYDLYLFDLDGTLISSYMDNEVKDFHSWYVLPGRTLVLDALREHGKRVSLVTNQAGLAFGYNTVEDFRYKQNHVSHYFHLTPDQWFVCFGHRKGTVSGKGEAWNYARRKPSGLMLMEAILYNEIPQDRTVMIGDMDSDYEAAKAAGVDYIDAKEFFQ